jgi:hypothetical protein
MTLFDFEELTAYWTEHPPLHILVAAYLGLGRGTGARPPLGDLGGRSRSSARATADVNSILADLGPCFGAGDVHAGLSPVVLDFEELQRGAPILVD